MQTKRTKVQREHGRRLCPFVKLLCVPWASRCVQFSLSLQSNQSRFVCLIKWHKALIWDKGYFTKCAPNAPRTSAAQRAAPVYSLARHAKTCGILRVRALVVEAGAGPDTWEVSPRKNDKGEEEEEDGEDAAATHL